MKNILFLFAVTSSVLFSSSCERNVAQPSNPELFKFDSLVVENNETYYSVNPSTKITAYATGDELKYHWSATAGEIFGSGKQVTYTSNPSCCGGYQTIQCIVQDKSYQTAVKKVEVYVGY